MTVPDESASELIVAAGRRMASEIPIIVRAGTVDGVSRLAALGAQYVIHPELEGGLEIVRHTFLLLGFPLKEVYQYADAVRRDYYDIQFNTEQEHRMMNDLLNASRSIEIFWLPLPADHPLIGRTLADANLRSTTGASVVAIIREGELMTNPQSQTLFAPEDRIGLIGDMKQIEAAERLLAAP